MKFLLIDIFVLIFFAFSNQKVFAQVVLNEVNPAPSSGSDWIELLNPTDQDLSLTGWSVQDSSSVLTTTPTLTNQTILAHNYFVVEVSNRLNNTNDLVKLFSPNGQIYDSMNYERTVTDQSWARQPDGTGSYFLVTPTRGYSNASSFPTVSPSPSTSPYPTPLPTPQPSLSPQNSPAASPIPSYSPSPTPISQPTSLPNHISFSEIMACPNTSESEWVELQNTEDAAYTLTNWQVRDSQNNTRYFTSQIAAQGYVVIPIAPAMLNNTGGDQVSLIRPDGAVASWISYSTCIKGKSLTFNGQNWIASEPSPGFANSAVTADTESASDNGQVEPVTSSDDTAESSEEFSAELSPSQTPQFFPSTSSTVDTALLLPPMSYQSSPSATPEKISKKQSTTSSSPAFSRFSLFTSSPALIIIPSSITLLLSSAWLFYTCYTEKSEEHTFQFE